MYRCIVVFYSRVSQDNFKVQDGCISNVWNPICHSLRWWGPSIHHRDDRMERKYLRMILLLIRCSIICMLAIRTLLLLLSCSIIHVHDIRILLRYYSIIFLYDIRILLFSCSTIFVPDINIVRLSIGYSMMLKY